MSDEPNKLDPSPHDWLELLASLQEMVKTGQLRAVTFMISDTRDPNNAVVDSYGKPEVVEIACRTAVTRIVSAIETTDLSLANAIRQGMPQARTCQ
jgi:hypothetical protein